MAEGAGVTIKSVPWTTGAYDLVRVAEGPEGALMSLNMKLAAFGNVGTLTLRGVTPNEMRKRVTGLK